MTRGEGDKLSADAQRLWLACQDLYEALRDDAGTEAPWEQGVRTMKGSIDGVKVGPILTFQRYKNQK